MSLVLVNKNIKKHIALINLNRPKAYNALTAELMIELNKVLQELQTDETVRVVVLTGNDKAFAAGADIKQLAGNNSLDMHRIDQYSVWRSLASFRKPLIAAVSGFALGGGCELALLCDMIIASDTSKFGQPEIKIGVIPGGGGTQRLTRIIGKQRAMEMILTGKFVSANEAFNMGFVNAVYPVEIYLQRAIELAERIASMSPVAVEFAKEAILKSDEMSLNDGLHFERRNYFMTFSSEDQKEGMNAFIEKRKPDFKGK